MKEEIARLPSPDSIMQAPPGHQMIYDSDTEDDDIPMNQSPRIERPNALRPMVEDDVPINRSPNINPRRKPASDIDEVPSYGNNQSYGNNNKPPRTPLAEQLNKDQNKKDITPPKKKITQDHASFTSGKKNNSSSFSRSTSRTSNYRYNK